MDYRFCDELSSGDLRSEIHSPGTSNEVGVSESPILEPKCLINLDNQVLMKCMVTLGANVGTRPVEDKMNFTSSQKLMIF